MPHRVLTTRHLNRALLARQLLLGRVRRSVPDAVERMGGIQAQYAPSAYIALWSRLEQFDRATLTRSLTRRSVVQGTLMRSTIHIVSAADYPLLAAGIRAPRREWWMRVAKSRGIDDLDHAAIAPVLRRELAAGPRRRQDLVDALVAAGYPKEAWEGAGLWVDMVRVPPSGTWERRRADLYALAETWLPGDHAAAEAAGLTHLLHRYLGAFGPAAPADAADWAGVPVAALTEAAERTRLRRFRHEDGTELIDLPRAPLPDPATPTPLRFLPTWDAVLLAHARRTAVLPEDHRPAIFHTRNPHSVGTFLVDGSVAGTWRFDGAKVVTHPFAPLPRAVRRELSDEADRLAAFHR